MAKPLGLRPVPVFDDEKQELTAKPRVAQATINDNFRLLASRVNRLETFDEENNRPLVFSAAQDAGGSIVAADPPTSLTPGTQVSFSTENTTAFAVVYATWDFEVVATGYGAAFGALWVTGGPFGAGTNVSSPQAVFQVPAVGYRWAVSNTWILNLTTPTTYTVQLYARKTVNGGDVTTQHFHTNQVVLVFDSA